MLYLARNSIFFILRAAGAEDPNESGSRNRLTRPGLVVCANRNRSSRVHIGTDCRAPGVVPLFHPANLVSVKAKSGLLFSGDNEENLMAGRVCLFVQ
jgi:hypothetical protein